MTELFQEGIIETGGLQIRYWERGTGPLLVHLHGAGGPRLQRSHQLLAEKHRVVVFEMPGFGLPFIRTHALPPIGMMATVMLSSPPAFKANSTSAWAAAAGSAPVQKLAMSAASGR